MRATSTINLNLIVRAAVFAFVAIGGMATGLGLTTYTMTKANDLVLASVSADASAGNQGKSCYLM